MLGCGHSVIAINDRFQMASSVSHTKIQIRQPVYYFHSLFLKKTPTLQPYTFLKSQPMFHFEWMLCCGFCCVSIVLLLCFQLHLLHAVTFVNVLFLLKPFSDHKISPSPLESRRKINTSGSIMPTHFITLSLFVLVTALPQSTRNTILIFLQVNRVLSIN